MGSEMCIRDRVRLGRCCMVGRGSARVRATVKCLEGPVLPCAASVADERGDAASNASVDSLASVV